MNETSSEAVDPDYEVTTDGSAVWVNGPGCFGRFGRRGIEIYTRTDRSGNGQEQLFCVVFYRGPKREHWDLFVEKMKEIHGVAIEPETMPKDLVE